MAVNLPATNKPRIVIIGGGFAGLELAKKLKTAEAQIVVVDKNNYHTFQPLLYQVATAGLEPDSIAYPLRKIFSRQKNFLFRMTEVLEVHPQKNYLATPVGEISYDYLVIATGSEVNYFGMKDFEEKAMTLKSVPDALNLRSLMLQNMEAALLTRDLEEQQSLMNFVIVGGGPTGVELAGALAELKNKILPSDYPDLDLRKMQIHIIEMEEELLPPMSDEASREAKNFLEKKNVNIWLRTAVKKYEADEVFYQQKVNNDEIKSGRLKASTVIWTAGVKGNVLKGLSEEAVEKGRILVNEFNRMKDSKNIFAIGDIAMMKSEEHPKGHPMLAPVAMQQGEQLAENFFKILKEQPPQPFKYKNKGVLATVGRNKAVADLPFMKSQGVIAWFLWMVVHIMQLVGFRNKLVVLIDWIWNYFNYDRAIRLIIRPFKSKKQSA